MLEKRFKGLWEQLQGKKPHLPDFLSEIRLKGIRGIDDLRIVFDYPVSVVAGGNATGKSTVLFAAACAYKVPGAGVRDHVPSTLFPDYRPRLQGRRDDPGEITLDFDYSTPEGRHAMRWRRSKGWNRSYFGRKNGSQPQRMVYLRTLSNLSNPSEVRGVLGMSRLAAAPREKPLTAAQIEFAQQVLPFRYSEVVDLTSGSRNLLFAAQEAGASYSELHMAAGERAILRLAQEIAQLDGALVLIDEVEAGLHPWIQQLLMLQLQQLALRNNLQVVVTTHSPAVLDSVPAHGRIFLDRDETGRVVLREPYRDIVQDALYGRSRDALNFLCEDEVAESILNGAFDRLCLRHGIGRESLRTGRETGAGEFPAHAAAFRKFGKISSFVFVLDGDHRRSDMEQRIQARAGSEVPVVYLPGSDAPEAWVWDALRTRRDDLARELGVDAAALAARMSRADSTFDSASDSAANIAKAKLQDLADHLSQEPSYICRAVARRETERKDSEIQPLVGGLEDALLRWRAEG